MCEEFEEELKRGQEAVRLLIEHIENMGAASGASMTHMTDNGCYIVEVRKTL